jgi:hypothetical protein
MRLKKKKRYGLYEAGEGGAGNTLIVKSARMQAGASMDLERFIMWHTAWTAWMILLR